MRCCAAVAWACSSAVRLSASWTRCCARPSELSSAVERRSASPGDLARLLDRLTRLGGRARLDLLRALDRHLGVRSRLLGRRLGDDRLVSGPNLAVAELGDQLRRLGRGSGRSPRAPRRSRRGSRRRATGRATSFSSASPIGSRLSVSDKLRDLPVDSVGGLVFGQLALQDLTRRVTRKFVDEDDLARHLVARQVRLDVVLELVLADLRAVLLDDEGAQPLAELLVVDADRGRLGDGLVIGEQVLDLAREDVLAARRRSSRRRGRR